MNLLQAKETPHPLVCQTNLLQFLGAKCDKLRLEMKTFFTTLS